MPNAHVELKGKCRRISYAKVDVPSKGLKAGDVFDVWSGGGAIEGLTGDELLQARYNDPNAGNLYGCIEEFFSTNPVRKPVKVDLTKVGACQTAVATHRAAEQEKADFILECSIECGSECSRESELRHVLKVCEIRTRGDSSAHDNILAKQVELDACCAKCESCCDDLLTTRDAAVTFRTPGD